MADRTEFAEASVLGTVITPSRRAAREDRTIEFRIDLDVPSAENPANTATLAVQRSRNDNNWEPDFEVAWQGNTRTKTGALQTWFGATVNPPDQVTGYYYRAVITFDQRMRASAKSIYKA